MRRHALVPLFWSALTVALLAAGLAACAKGSARIHAEPAESAIAATSAEDAVRLLIESQGATYAGDCAATRSPQDIGKVCSKLIDTRGDVRAYITGRTFSEFSEWVFVQQDSTGWRTLATAPLDFHAVSMDIPWPR